MRGRILRRVRSTNQCRWELTKQYPGYKIVQLNFIMDIVVVVFFWGGWSKELDVCLSVCLSVDMSKIFGAGSNDILKRMQKAVMSKHAYIINCYNNNNNNNNNNLYT